MKTMKQILEMTKNGKPESTFPIEPDSTTALVPRSKDEKRFVDKHVIAKKADANGNGDDVFNASNIKAYDRSTSNHGYNTKQDQAVYEGRTLFQILGEKKMTKSQIKKRKEIADAIHRENPDMPIEKKFRIATAAAMKEDYVDESTGVTDYNPKSPHGTRKGLLDVLTKTKDPKHAEAARKAGATQKELQQAMKSEETDLTESEIAEKQYSKHFNATKKLLDHIADAMDTHSHIITHKLSTAEWHHVDTMKNLHDRLSSLHDEVMRHVDYARPMKLKTESFDDLLKVFDPDTAQIISQLYDTVNDVDKEIIENMIVNEDYDSLQSLLDELTEE